MFAHRYPDRLRTDVRWIDRRMPDNTYKRAEMDTRELWVRELRVMGWIDGRARLPVRFDGNAKPDDKEVIACRKD